MDTTTVIVVTTLVVGLSATIWFVGRRAEKSAERTLNRGLRISS